MECFGFTEEKKKLALSKEKAKWTQLTNIETFQCPRKNGKKENGVTILYVLLVSVCLCLKPKYKLNWFSDKLI